MIQDCTRPKITNINTAEKLIFLGMDLNSRKYLKDLLEFFLMEARKISNADAGSVYLLRENVLYLVCSQNDTLSAEGGQSNFQELCQGFNFNLNMRTIPGYAAVKKAVVAIDDVYDIPPGIGFEFNSDFDGFSGYHSTSMLVLPILDSNEKVTGILQLVNAKKKNAPQDEDALEQDDSNIVPFDPECVPALCILASQSGITIKNILDYEKMRKVHLDSLFCLCCAAEFRDKETPNHIKRVSEIAAFLGRTLDMSYELVEELRWAAAVHDVGKVGVSNDILSKPGPLSENEFELVKLHSMIGANILSHADNTYLLAAQEVALYHHEKWNGLGYPKGLAKNNIPIFAQITALADVYDTLASKRPYKEAFPLEKVAKIIAEEKGEHFNPLLVEIFLDKQEEFKAIAARYEDGEDQLTFFRDPSLFRLEPFI